MFVIWNALKMVISHHSAYPKTQPKIICIKVKERMSITCTVRKILKSNPSFSISFSEERERKKKKESKIMKKWIIKFLIFSEPNFSQTILEILLKGSKTSFKQQFRWESDQSQILFKVWGGVNIKPFFFLITP